MFNSQEITEGDIERILSLLNGRNKEVLLNVFVRKSSDNDLDSLFYGVKTQLLSLIRHYKIEFYYLLAYYSTENIESREEIKRELREVSKTDVFIRFVEDGTKYSTEDCALLDLENVNFMDSVEKMVIDKNLSQHHTYDDTDYSPEEFLNLLGDDFKPNYVQRVVSNVAFNTDDDFLVCAPTGIGKTIIAAMRIYKLKKEIGNNVKIAYLAPIKALANEVYCFFKDIFRDLEVVLAISDTNTDYYQLHNSNIIVGTPEKIDLITRNTFIQFNLIVIDEIHILNDARGYVIEGIVARCMRSSKTKFIGMSGTVYNYEDVGNFLGVRYHNVFIFGEEYRPSQIDYDMVLTENLDIELDDVLSNALGPVVVFVHTQKDTLKTAEHIKQYYERIEDICTLITSESDLNDFNSMDNQIRELIHHRIGIHHSGLSVNTRHTIERFFKKGIIHVLISTATLAWGVNLPIQTVIIKGSTYYNAEVGEFVELSSMEIRQMFGRAGRYPNMVGCKGILISTTTSNLHFNQTIESRILPNICNLVLAEIYLGINNFRDLMDWFNGTFYVTRLMKYNGNSFNLSKNILFTALTLLRENKMITGFEITDYGKIAVKYYIDYLDVLKLVDNLKPVMRESCILDLVGQLSLFKKLRGEIKNEEVKIPCETKFGLLLQVYYTGKIIDDDVVNQSISQIKQNLPRILGAVLEIAVINKSLVLFYIIEHMKAFDLELKPGVTPFRHFEATEKIIRAIENKKLPYKVFRGLKEKDFKELEIEGHANLKYLPFFNVEVKTLYFDNDKMILFFDIEKNFDDSRLLTSKFMFVLRDFSNNIILIEAFYLNKSSDFIGLTFCIPKRRFIQIDIISFEMINTTVTKAFDLFLAKPLYEIHKLKEQDKIDNCSVVYISDSFDTLMIYDQIEWEMSKKDVLLVNNYEIKVKLVEEGHKTLLLWEYLDKAHRKELKMDENYIIVNAHEVIGTPACQHIIHFSKTNGLKLKLTGFCQSTRFDDFIISQSLGFWGRIYDFSRRLVDLIKKHQQKTHLVIVSNVKVVSFLENEIKKQFENEEIQCKTLFFNEIEIDLRPKNPFDIVHIFDTQYLDYSTDQFSNYKPETIYFFSRCGKKSIFYLQKNIKDLFFRDNDLQIPYKHKQNGENSDLLSPLLENNNYFYSTGLSLESLKYLENNLKNNMGIKAILTLIFSIDELHQEVVDPTLKDHKDVHLGLKFIKLDKLMKDPTISDSPTHLLITNLINVIIDICSKMKYLKTMFNLIFIIQKINKQEDKFYEFKSENGHCFIEVSLSPTVFYLVYNTSEYEILSINTIGIHLIQPMGDILYIMCDKTSGYEKIIINEFN